MRWSLLVLLLVTSLARADDVPLAIKGDTKVVKVDRVIVVQEDRTVINSFPFTVNAPQGAALYFWQFPSTVVAIDKGDRLEVTSASKGLLTIGVKVTTVDWDARKFVTSFGSVTVAIGDVGPGPLPPGPTPPDPPAPQPGPPTDKPRVLVVYETSELTKLPATQWSMLHGEDLWKYLNAKLPKEGSRNWSTGRVWDKDVNTSAEIVVWQDWMKRPRQSLPWLIVGTPTKGGFEGPLPKTIEETLATLKKYLE